MNKRKFRFISDLISCQKEMLGGKSKALEELYDLCDNEEKESLVKQLLVDFTEMNDDIYSLCLDDMSKYIVNKGFPLAECMVVAMCHDHLADSSQEVLQDIKLPLELKKFPNKNYCNRADKCFRKSDKAVKHFFIVDDFVGSGHTVNSRIKSLSEKANGREYTLHFVIVAGMEHAVKMLKDNGVDIYCSYTVKRGITDRYSNDQVDGKLALMDDLESHLAERINQTDLALYHFGYRQSEAIFTRRNKNVPNNVFPLFWWKCDNRDNPRTTLFHRVQNGY